MDASRQLAEVARRLRTDGVEGCSEEYAALGVGFMAPVATVFAAWVLGRARDQGVERLYFLSRDCQLILTAACKLAPQFGNMDCRYLQVSRQALFLPSSTGLSEEGMPWLFEKTDRHSLGSQLAKLELSVEEFSPNASEETVLETEEEIRDFWATLNQPPLRDKLLSRIDERQRAARVYFEEEGLLDDVSWAVVDIGWLLRCQRSLTGLLQGMGRKKPVQGFYLGVQAERELEENTGPVKALFCNPVPGYGAASPLVFKQVVLIENLFCTADHPSVHHYESGPCYNRGTDSVTAERFRNLERVFSIFAEQCDGFARELADPETAAEWIEQLIDRFLNRPILEAVRPLAAMKVSFLQNDLRPFPVVRPLTFREALAPVFPRWTWLKPLWKGPCVMWHRGSVTVSRPAIQKLYRVAYRVRSVRMRFKWFQ